MKHAGISILFVVFFVAGIGRGNPVAAHHIDAPATQSSRPRNALIAKAGQGDATAMERLGDDYRLGRGVPRNYSKALAWYWKAAEHGDTSAMEKVGVMFEQGLGVKNDLTKAVYWWKKSAHG